MKRDQITSTGGDGRTYQLVTETEGTPLVVGQRVKGFRGTYKVEGGRAPQHTGSTGKVWTDKGEFFPSVVGAKWEAL
jgi:hypothetical protein